MSVPEDDPISEMQTLFALKDRNELKRRHKRRDISRFARKKILEICLYFFVIGGFHIAFTLGFLENRIKGTDWPFWILIGYFITACCGIGWFLPSELEDSRKRMAELEKTVKSLLPNDDSSTPHP